MGLPENDKNSSHRMLEVVNLAVYLFDLNMCYTFECRLGIVAFCCLGSQEIAVDSSKYKT